MINDLLQKVSFSVLLLLIFLEAYAIFYATETKKAARQLGMSVPSNIKILIATSALFPLIGFIILLFLFISAFFI